MSNRALRARIVLDEARALGLDLADLIAADVAGTSLPTLGAYIEEISATFTAATARTYRPLLAARRHPARRATPRRDHPGRPDGGRQRCRSTGDRQPSCQQWARATRNLCRRPPSGLRPSPLVRPDRSQPSSSTDQATPHTRPPPRPHDHELSELIDAVRTTSRDPDLDLVLIRFHLESGARREGALNLRHRDLDPPRATVWLREKNDSEREQPVSPSLIKLLDRLTTSRGGGSPDQPVFRSLTGQPLSTRRYDTLFDRARTCRSWAERTPVSAHVLRHTAITAVGRLAGYPVAQAFAGHAPPSVTGRYIHATLTEIATAIATPHRRTPPPRRQFRRLPDRLR